MTLIQRLDGTTYDLLDYGIRTRDVLISSPVYEHSFSAIEGSIGLIDNGSTVRERTINCLYRATSHDIQDFSLLRDEIFDIFRSEESFYLIEKRLPGKRWLVKVSNPFQVPQRNVFGNFDIEFISIRGVSESIGTTQDIEKNGIRYSDELWSYGMGLSYDETTHKYIFNNLTTFFVYNAGNVTVDPFEMDLEIIVTGVQGKFTIENVTTGDKFEYTGNLNGRRMRIQGANVLVNNAQDIRNTNKKFIRLAPGSNQFNVTANAKVEFDFRFYYK